jgi:hypothetical protein
MQLMVDNAAVALLQLIGKAGIEPVLSEFVGYYERDEARHVGLGVLALPSILTDLSRSQAAALYWFHTKLYLLMIAAGLTVRTTVEDLGVDRAKLQRCGFRLQQQAFAETAGEPNQSNQRHGSPIQSLNNVTLER